MKQIRNLRAVTVCACGEYALGAGLELAMSCDFRLVVDDAVLGLPEIDVGLVTGIQGGLLIRLVGLQAAKELIFTGDPISGERAVELGLINYAASPDSYEQLVQDLVSTLASKPLRIVKWQNDVFRTWRSFGIESGIEHSGETIGYVSEQTPNAMSCIPFWTKANPTVGVKKFMLNIYDFILAKSG